MAINPSQFSVDAAGAIRQTSAFIPGTSARYTTLELHAWLQAMAASPTTVGDDLVSIKGPNPSALAGKRNINRPMAVTLLPDINLDDATAQWFNFGSVEQQGGQVLYTGLKVLGALVPNSPIYITQSNAKLPKYWADSDTGNFQILVKAKTGGALIDGGAVTVFSRKFGQTYSHFDTSLAAGSEQPAALGTAIDTNVALSAAAAEAVWNTITITTGDTNQDLGGGQGSKLHKGTITLDGSTTLAQAYQALMWACSELSTATVAGVPGWRYRRLNAAYTENVTAPFGTFAGGKFFVAQGWWLAGVMAGDSKNYELISDDGTTQTAPTSVNVQVGGLAAGDYVLVVRDDGAGGILTNEYTVSATASATTVTVPGLKIDTPPSGSIYINSDPYTYTGRAGNELSGLVPAIKSGGYASKSAFVPLIDQVATGTSAASASFQFVAPFTCRYRARNGTDGSAIVPFESTLTVTETGGSGTVVRNADE